MQIKCIEYSLLDTDCTICGDLFENKDVLYCNDCEIPYHEDCVNYIGKCGIYSCGSNQFYSNKGEMKFIKNSPLENINDGDLDVLYIDDQKGEKNNFIWNTIFSLLITGLLGMAYTSSNTQNKTSYNFPTISKITSEFTFVDTHLLTRLEYIDKAQFLNLSTIVTPNKRMIFDGNDLLAYDNGIKIRKIPLDQLIDEIGVVQRK